MRLGLCLQHLLLLGIRSQRAFIFKHFDCVTRLNNPLNRFLSDTLAIPLYVAVVSFTVLTVHLLLVSPFYQRLKARIFSTTFIPEATSDFGPGVHPTLSAEIKEHVTQHGGGRVFAYKLARLLGSICLLGLSIYSTVVLEDPADATTLGKWGRKKKNKRPKKPDFSVSEWLAFGTCMVYVRIF